MSSREVLMDAVMWLRIWNRMREQKKCQDVLLKMLLCPGPLTFGRRRTEWAEHPPTPTPSLPSADVVFEPVAGQQSTDMLPSARGFDGVTWQLCTVAWLWRKPMCPAWSSHLENTSPWSKRSRAWEHSGRGQVLYRTVTSLNTLALLRRTAVPRPSAKQTIAIPGSRSFYLT